MCYLLNGGVADGVGVVVVVDDLEIPDGFAFQGPHEADLRGGLACPLGVNGEVGRLTHLHAFRDRRYVRFISFDYDGTWDMGL